MNISLLFSIWKEASAIGDIVGKSGEEVIRESLDLYTETYINEEDVVSEETENLNQFISDLDTFIKETLDDKESVHYNFVVQLEDTIKDCDEIDSGFEFKMRKFVQILYKKNKEYSKQFLDDLGVSRQELREKILNTVFNGDV